MNCKSLVIAFISMVKNCEVIDCGKAASTHSISLFRCPTEEKARYMWLKFLTRANREYDGFWEPRKEIYVCSEHFLADSIEVLPSERLRPKKNTFPSLLHGQTILNEHETELEYDNLSSITVTLTESPADFSTENYENKLDSNTLLDQRNKEVSELRESLNCKDNIIADLTSRLSTKEAEVTERLTLSKKTILISSYQTKLYTLTRKAKRQAKAAKRKAEKQDLHQPKRLKTSSHQRLDENAVNILKELLERSEMSATATFSDALREFAFGIYYHSTRAYEKLRRTVKTLPFVTSFRRWTGHIKSSAGFLPSAVEFIKTRTSQSPYKLHYALMVDEVHIRRQILPYKGGFTGYVDYGDMATPVYSNKEASAALFVMANEINGYHKVPLGYILTNGLPKSVLAEVLRNSLNKMKDCNANVISVTFDGLAANLKAAEALGAKMDVRKPDFDPKFDGGMSANNVHIVLDASHMIKLLRNVFKQYQVLVNNDGKEIKWEYIEKLEQLQEAEGLRAANKITSRHVNFQNQKMRTKLAVQTLSGSAAIALRFCREICIPGFEDTSATEEFLNMSNKLFDYLNSIRYDKGDRFPITWQRYDEVRQFFSTCKDYFSSLKFRHNVKGVIVDTRLIDSAKKTAVHGLIITMTSIENIMMEVLAVSSSDLKYLPTFKISQDPLENFFSILRSRYGFNNNPNVIQLEHGVKGIICMKTKSIKSGNCIEQEELSSKISALGNFKTVIDDDSTLEPEEYEQLELEDLSLYSSNVVMYIAGYVARKLVKSLNCQSCILKLYASETDIPLISADSSLTVYRDKGGLFLSSFAMFSVCRITEQVIRSKENHGIRNLRDQEVVNFVIHESIERRIFRSLDCGFISRNFKEPNHANKLIQQIALTYCKTRFRHIGNQATLRLKPTTNRNVLTKSIHFAGN